MGIILDTFNDERRAFAFQVNPFGVQMDGIYDDVNQREDNLGMPFGIALDKLQNQVTQ